MERVGMAVGEALRHSYGGCHGRQGSGVRRELPGLRRQAALSGPLATGVFSLSARNSSSADLGSSHQGLLASHC